MQVDKAEESPTAKPPIALSAAASVGQREMGWLKGTTSLERESPSLSGTAEILAFAATHRWD